jgi:hypothetical protein
MRSCIIFTLHQILLGLIKEDEMDGALSEHGKMRNAYEFWLKGLKGRVQSEDLGLDVRIILKWILGNPNPTCYQKRKLSEHIRKISYIFNITKLGVQMNEKYIVTINPIFDILIVKNHI